MLAGWLPLSYSLSQCTILALGFWAIVHHERVVQIELVCVLSSIFSTRRFSSQLMMIKTLSIILDSVAIGMYFQIGRQGSFAWLFFPLHDSIFRTRAAGASRLLHHQCNVSSLSASETTLPRPSCSCAILLLVLKPIMLLLLNKVRQERLGDPLFNTWGSASGYVSVDGR
jgi:hypothetical protein